MIEMFGTIKQVYPSTTFGVELEISPYDLTKGRIIYRYRAGEARRSSAAPA